MYTLYACRYKHNWGWVICEEHSTVQPPCQNSTASKRQGQLMDATHKLRHHGLRLTRHSRDAVCCRSAFRASGFSGNSAPRQAVDQALLRDAVCAKE